MVDSGNTYKDKVSQLISWGHWFSFFNIIAAMLLGISYITNSNGPDTFIGHIYQFLTWIGHFGFLVFAVYILLIFPATFLIPSQRLMRLFAVFTATAGMTLLILDIYAYKTLHLHLTPLVWDLLLSGENTDINAHWQYLFVSVPAIFLLELAISEWVWRKLRKLSRKRVGLRIAIIFTLCFLSSHLIYIWADAFLHNSVTAQRANFPLSYPMTAKSFMEKYGLFDRKEYQRRRADISHQVSTVIRYPLSELSFAPTANAYQPNLLIVMVDSLRADMVDPLIMPNLTKFAEKNQFFTQHFSTSNDYMPGVLGLFYGLPSNYAQSIRTEGLRPLLLQLLERRKYQFGLFSADNFNNPVYYRSIFNRELDKLTKVQAQSPWLADQEVIAAFTNWQAQTTSPWFSYVELKAVAGYEQGGNYAKPFQPALETVATPKKSHTSLLLKNSYNNAAHYVDSLLKNVIDSVAQNEGLKNTIIVITSSNGLEFNETATNSWGANSNYSRYQLQVPLVIHWPNNASQKITNFSSHLDLVPTLMESMLGINTPADQYSSGQNLFELAEHPRPWIIAGDSRDIVVVQENKTTVVDKFGNYRVYDKYYQLQPTAKPQLSVLMQVMHEINRFYHPLEQE